MELIDCATRSASQGATTAKDSMMQRLSFLELPFELRSTMYKYLFRGQTLHGTHDRISVSDDSGCVRRAGIQLAFTCVLLYREVYTAFWRYVRFELHTRRVEAVLRNGSLSAAKRYKIPTALCVRPQTYVSHLTIWFGKEQTGNFQIISSARMPGVLHRLAVQCPILKHLVVSVEYFDDLFEHGYVPRSVVLASLECTRHIRTIKFETQHVGCTGPRDRIRLGVLGGMKLVLDSLNTVIQRSRQDLTCLTEIPQSHQDPRPARLRWALQIRQIMLTRDRPAKIPEVKLQDLCRREVLVRSRPLMRSSTRTRR